MKQCSVCQETKPFLSFHKQKSGPGGYRSACKDCRKGEHTDRYAENKHEWNQRAVAWRVANPDKAKLIGKKFREANRKQRNDYKNDWAQANKGHVNAYNVKRHAAKLKRTPAWLSDFDKLKIECLYQLATMRTRESGYDWHVDHIIPLQGKFVSGLHVPSNLRVIPAVENNRKYNRYEVT
jgi:5-methylcytosine-specific restriction endonuclease McrA